MEQSSEQTEDVLTDYLLTTADNTPSYADIIKVRGGIIIKKRENFGHFPKYGGGHKKNR